MPADDWLDEARDSYDADADAYAEVVTGLLDGNPALRAGLALFADSVADTGGGPVADVGCGPGYVTRHLHDLGVDTHRRTPGQVSTWLRDSGFTLDAEFVLRPDDDVPGAIVFAHRPAGHRRDHPDAPVPRSARPRRISSARRPSC